MSQRTIRTLLMIFGTVWIIFLGMAFFFPAVIGE